MSENKIMIIGGGFAGLAALAKLAGYRMGLDITLIDKKTHSDFLPELPDVIGRGIAPEYLTCDISKAARRYRAKFLNDEVISVDTAYRKVKTRTNEFQYDYLLVTSGSETNFYGQEDMRKAAYKLDDIDDAKNIRSDVMNKKFDNYVISGGGYTGVEVATNLRVLLNKLSRKGKIVIVEKGPSILGPLPEWMKAYVLDNLRRLDIEVKTGTVAERSENTMLIWTTGVKTDDFVWKLGSEKNPQGRLKTDEFLRVDERIFAAGDAAYFLYKDKPLRMAVQFSIFEARKAAVNIVNSIRHLDLEKYRPIDLGYIIPMANNRSCGIVCGIRFKGTIATFFHYAMCIYRSMGLRNKFGILRGLLS